MNKYLVKIALPMTGHLIDGGTVPGTGEFVEATSVYVEYGSLIFVVENGDVIKAFARGRWLEVEKVT